MENQGELFSYYFDTLHDVADFMLFDDKFRTAKEKTSPEDPAARKTVIDGIYEILNHNGAIDGNKKSLIRKWKGEITRIPEKSPVRTALLKFLQELDEKTPAPEKLSGKESSPFGLALTAAEAQEKTKAKTAYANGNYRVAIKKLEKLCTVSRNAAEEVGIIGMMVNCYFKLEDYINTLKYAEKYMEKKKKIPDDVPMIGMAATAAFKLGEYKKAFEYAMEVLSVRPEYTEVFIIGFSAMMEKAKKDTPPTSE